MSLVLGLGLEHSCPWPREVCPRKEVCLYLALASNFFCVLGLGLEPCVLDSTSGSYNKNFRRFFKLFPYSLLLQIAYYTNKRLDMFQNAKKKKIAPTDAYETMKLFGCFFIMSYNHLPSINHYWSTHTSMGNSLMKSTFCRDRFKLIMSKLYVAEPDKPQQTSKQVVLCWRFALMPEINLNEVQTEQSISKYWWIKDKTQGKVFFQTIPSLESCEMRDKAMDAICHTQCTYLWCECLYR